LPGAVPPHSSVSPDARQLLRMMSMGSQLLPQTPPPAAAVEDMASPPAAPQAPAAAPPIDEPVVAAALEEVPAETAEAVAPALSEPAISLDEAEASEVASADDAPDDAVGAAAPVDAVEVVEEMAEAALEVEIPAPEQPEPEDVATSEAAAIEEPAVIDEAGAIEDMAEPEEATVSEEAAAPPETEPPAIEPEETAAGAEQPVPAEAPARPHRVRRPRIREVTDTEETAAAVAEPEGISELGGEPEAIVAAEREELPAAAAVDAEPAAEESGFDDPSLQPVTGNVKLEAVQGSSRGAKFLGKSVAAGINGMKCAVDRFNLGEGTPIKVSLIAPRFADQLDIEDAFVTGVGEGEGKKVMVTLRFAETHEEMEDFVARYFASKPSGGGFFARFRR